MRRFLLALAFVLVASFAFGQDVPPPDDGVLNLMTIIAVLVTGAGIPLLIEVLKVVWPKAPSWLKALAAPVIVPLVTVAASYLSGWLGVPVDVSGIIEVLTTVGVASSVAYTLGDRKGYQKGLRRAA